MTRQACAASQIVIQKELHLRSPQKLQYGQPRYITLGNYNPWAKGYLSGTQLDATWVPQYIALGPLTRAKGYISTGYLRRLSQVGCCRSLHDMMIVDSEC